MEEIRKNFNIRHAFIIGVAINRDCHNFINEIYDKNEKEYYEAYMSTGLRNDALKSTFVMNTEDIINKLSGIIEVAYIKKDFIIIEKIINKIHPSIVRFVKNSNVVDLDLFKEKYFTNKFIGEDFSFSCGISLLYLAYIKKKEYRGDSYISFILGKWEMYELVVIRILKSIDNHGLIQDEEFTKDIIEKGYTMFDLNSSISIQNKISCFFDDVIEGSVFKDLGIIDYKNSDISKINATRYENIRNKKFKSGLYRYIGGLSRYLNSLGFDSGDILTDTDIDNAVLENIFRDFSYSVKFNNVDEDKFELYAVSCLYIYNLVSLYKDCKYILLNKSKEEKYTELREMEARLMEEKVLFNTKCEETNTIIKNNNSEIKELKKKLKELERENNKINSDALKDKALINKLTNSNDELSKSNNELSIQIAELEEKLNSIDTFNQTSDEISLEYKIEVLNEYKIGVFGGMNSIKNLSDKLDNITYYNELNQDISSINSLDIVFINTDFINHAFTYKIKSMCEKLNKPMRYISGTNNNRIIGMIYDELNNYELVK